MIQIKYGCVIFLVAIFVVTVESGCSSQRQTLIHLSKFRCACTRPDGAISVFR